MCPPEMMVDVNKLGLIGFSSGIFQPHVFEEPSDRDIDEARRLFFFMFFILVFLL